MSVNLPKAVVLAAFVNDPGKNLTSLNKERERISQALGVKNDDFELMEIQDATSENLWECFSKFGKRIVAFHFAGHANGMAEKIILKDEAGNNRGTLIEALADAEALLPMLQLVFLNGCATSSGVKHFIHHKKLVIATRAKVGDSTATTFSIFFWTWLADNPGDSIITAFDYAKSKIKDLDSLTFKKRFRDKTGDLENNKTLLNQWDLYGLENYVGSTQLFRGAYFAARIRHGSKKLYDQNPLKKRLQQQGEEMNYTFFDLPVVEQKKGDKENLIESLKEIYKRPIRHTLLLSSGGGGKTISLVNVWKYHLKEGIYPIPIFIRMNQINDAPEEAKEDFISWYIATKYLGLTNLTTEVAEYLKEWLSSDWEQPSPKLLLLLDGFNEITAGESVEAKLFTDFKNRWSGEQKVEAQGIQIVVSSRYESTDSWTYRFVKLELQPIDQAAVMEHLGPMYPREPDLQRLILNPLMLTLYSASSEIWEQYKDNKSFEFKNQITNAGELLWNYLEAQVVKQFVQYEDKDPQYRAAHFILKHLIPYLGFHMERDGVFRFSREQLEKLISQASKQFLNQEFTNAFPRYKKGIKELEDLKPKPPDEFIEEQKRIYVWVDRLTSRFHFLEVEATDQSGEPVSFTFSHQIFRDFFSAIHLRNLMENGIHQNQKLYEIHNRPWPRDLRQMIGELEINHYPKPEWDDNNKSWVRSETVSEKHLLLNYLNLYRNEFDEATIEYGLWNIIETWKQLVLDLSGMDLSNLNLAGINLNKMILTRKGSKNTLAANFNGSKLNFDNFFANGHFGRVVCVIYHPTLPNIISSDTRGVIKVWSTNTVNCNLTINAHLSSVNKIVFNDESSSIISCSDNGNIKEWDFSTGRLIKTFTKEHNAPINDIKLNSNSEFLISASLDTLIKIWDIKTGQCIKTLRGHKYGVTCVSIHPEENRLVSGSEKGEIFQWVDNQFSTLFTIDKTAVWAIKYNKLGDKILVGNASGIAVEYTFKDNKILKQYDKHNGDVFDVLYDQEETSFFTASWEYPKNNEYDGIIRQWSLEDDDSLMRTFEGHSGRVLSLDLDPHSNKLVSSSYDRNIYEWSIGTGRKINEFLGISFFIWELILHPLKENTIVFGATDHVIREWDLKLDRCTIAYVGHTLSVTQILFSSDGKKMYSGSDDGTIREWSTESGECLKIFNNIAKVSQIAISHTGKFLLAGSTNGLITEWPITSDQWIGEYVSCRGNVTTLEYLQPNGEEFLSFSHDLRLNIWKRGNEYAVSKIFLEPLRPLNSNERIKLGKGKYVRPIRVFLSESKDRIFVSNYNYGFKNDGSLIDDGSFIEYLFDFNLFAKGEKDYDLILKMVRSPYEGHSQQILTLSFYPDKNRILTGSFDNTIKEWSTESRDCLNTYEADSKDFLFKYGSNARAVYLGKKKNIAGVISGEIIYIWKIGVKEPIRSIHVQPGMLIEGLDLTNVKWANNLSDQQKGVLEMHGAIL